MTKFYETLLSLDGSDENYHDIMILYERPTIQKLRKKSQKAFEKLLYLQTKIWSGRPTILAKMDP